MSPDRKRMLILLLVMAASCLVVAGSTMGVLYKAHLEDELAHLDDEARAIKALVDAVADFDRVHSDDLPGGHGTATMSQLENAIREFRGFGETGELVVGKRSGDNIEFVLRRRHESAMEPSPFLSALI